MNDRFKPPDEPRMRECDVCRGSGLDPTPDDCVFAPCPECDGSGEVPAPAKSSGNIDPDDTEGREV